MMTFTHSLAAVRRLFHFHLNFFDGKIRCLATRERRNFPTYSLIFNTIHVQKAFRQSVFK